MLNVHKLTLVRGTAATNDSQNIFGANGDARVCQVRFMQSASGGAGRVCH